MIPNNDCRIAAGTKNYTLEMALTWSEIVYSIIIILLLQEIVMGQIGLFIEKIEWKKVGDPLYASPEQVLNAKSCIICI